MEEFKYDTYCGIYCGACSVLMHGRTGRADAFAACLGRVPKDGIACHGCKSDTVYAGCRLCKFRDCARDKGVEYCVECADYPCKLYTKWQGAASILPHVAEAPQSLKSIRQNGPEIWLEAQKKRWACPRCGTPFSWYETQCSNCRRDVGAFSYELAGFKKFLCRIILPLVYRKGKAKRSK
jgi:hypothetical protein